MIKESFAALGASTRDLFRNWRGLLLLAAVYGLLLASVYYFFATGVANVWQLDGGILKYFEETGGSHFEGNCFVFDEREALSDTLVPTSPL